MSRFKYIFLLSLFTFLFAFCKGQSKEKRVFKYDTVSRQKIDVPKAQINKLKQHYSFKYQHPSASAGFGRRFFLWLRDLYVFKVISQMASWVVYSILILAFVIILIFLFRGKFQGVFIANPKDNRLNLTENEIAENIDLNNLLDEAVTQKKYNLAIRYHYLMLLRLLNQKSLITYKPGKTNFEYLSEIGNAELIPQFRTATRNYEYAWYGQFSLSEALYLQIVADYNYLTNKLND